MKSFNQFLEENYLNEEPVGRPAKKRPPGGPSYEQEMQKITARETEEAARKAQRGPTGAAAMPELQFRPQGTTTTVPGSNVRGPEGGGTTPPSPPTTGRRSRVNGRVVPGIDKRQLPKPTSSTASTPPKPTGPGGGGGGGTKPPTSSARQGIQNTKTGTDLAKTATDTLGKGGRFSKWGGRALGAAGAALDAADEYKAQRERGRSRGSSVAMGVTKAAGGIAGAEAGASGGAALGATIGSVVPGAGTAIGAGIGGVVGGIGGYMAGSGLAGKASEVVAGATKKEKAAMATANRQRQAGSAIKGIGGPTSFNTKNNTITTGTGAQRRTAQLGKTSVVTGPGGKQETGYLAYKGGKAVYKRADTKSLAQTSSNPLERFARSTGLFAGAYKANDAKLAAKKLATARQSDVARNKALGVKMLPGK